MYSLNVPVPGSVSRLARGLAADLREATPRDRHTLVVKRLGAGDPRRLTRSVREEIAGTPPFDARIAGVGVFENPPTGRAPVTYLRVESPELERLHERLCRRFEPVDGIEADGYVPHVTIARGGDAARLDGRELTHTWRVEALSVWSADYGEPVERIALPA